MPRKTPAMPRPKRLSNLLAKYSYNGDFQRKLFKVFTPLAYSFLLTYMVVQFYQGHTLLGGVYAAACIVLLINLLYLKKHGNYGVAANIFAAIGPLVLLPLQVTGVFGYAAFLWLMAYIWFALTFTGRYFGSFWLGVTYGTSLVISSGQLNNARPLYSGTFLLQFYFSSAVVYFLVVYFLKAQDEVSKTLQKQQELLEQSQKVARLGNWEWDIQSDRVTWSKELFHIFGKKQTGKKISYDTYMSSVHPDDRKMLNETIQTALQNRQPFSVEHRVKTGDGKTVWVLGQGRLLVDENGKPSKMIGTAQDITDRKNTEQELQKQNRDLQKLNALMVGRELKMVDLKKRLAEMPETEDRQ